MIAAAVDFVYTQNSKTCARINFSNTQKKEGHTHNEFIMNLMSLEIQSERRMTKRSQQSRNTHVQIYFSFRFTTTPTHSQAASSY